MSAGPANGHPRWLAEGFKLENDGSILGEDGSVYLPELLSPPPAAPKPTQKKSVSKLTLLNTGEMLATEPPPVDWLASGVVARGTLSLLAGREKEGKTLLCQGICTTMASGGGSLGGIECSAGRALVVDAENGKAVIQRRLHALGLRREHKDELFFAEALGFDLRTHLGQLGELIVAVRPDLVVLDSWRSLWGGKENDSDEVTACLDPLRNLARKLNVGVVLIHHMSRAGLYRGSTAAGASVENILALSHQAGDPEPLRRLLSNAGCRYDEPAPDRWLSIEGNRKLGVIVVDEADPYDDPEQLAISPRAPVRSKLEPRVGDALTGGWQKLADICAAVDRPPKDRSVRRVLDALADRGEAERNDAGAWRRVEPESGEVAEAIGARDTLPPATQPPLNALTADIFDEGP